MSQKKEMDRFRVTGVLLALLLAVCSLFSMMKDAQTMEQRERMEEKNGNIKNDI